MRAFTLFACVLALAVVTTVSATAQEDPCVSETLRCRDEICAGREVLQNECESGEGSFMKACSCGAPIVAQQQPQERSAATAGDLLDQVMESARLGVAEEQQEQQEMDCDEMMTEGGEQQAQAREEQQEQQEQEEESEEYMTMPQLGGFTFRFNLGRRFGPQGEQQQQQPRAQRVRFVQRPSLGSSPFSSIFSGGGSGGGGSDYGGDSFFDNGSGGGGSLLDALFGPSPFAARPRQIPVARQQFLLGAPSFMTRRVFYPDVQSQQAQQQQPAMTMRLATPQELKAMGLLDESSDYANNNNNGEAALLGQQQQQRSTIFDVVDAARRREAAMNALEQWKTAAGVQQQQDAMRPMPPVRLAELPRVVNKRTSATGAVPAVPVPVAPDADADAEEGEKAWYNGYRARRALYCVASIALVMAIIALNAALLMCCASACCRGFCESEEGEDFTVESVAATTPLLVEYEVERVPKPGYEHVTEEEMIVVSMAPMPREGKAAY